MIALVHECRLVQVIVVHNGSQVTAFATFRRVHDGRRFRLALMDDSPTAPATFPDENEVIRLQHGVGGVATLGIRLLGAHCLPPSFSVPVAWIANRSIQFSAGACGTNLIPGQIVTDFTAASSDVPVPCSE